MNKEKQQLELEKADVKNLDALLQVSEYGLLRIGSFGPVDVERLLQNAAVSVLETGFISALEAEKLSDKWRRLSTGCSILDRVLGGGFSTRGITEIAGESGCGKTQLCLQLCLSVQYFSSHGGLGSGAVYICTEDTFPAKRLQQLILTYPQQRLSSISFQGDLPKFGDNIFIEHIADAAGMRQCVLGRLPKLLYERSVKLIVIDSVAGVFRSSYENNEMKNRAEDMRTVGGQLHKLASQFNACVICVNQVTATDGPGQCVPALGLAWSNLVTTRVQLHKVEMCGADSAPQRFLEIVFAPDLPSASVSYSISEAGVFGYQSEQSS